MVVVSGKSKWVGVAVLELVSVRLGWCWLGVAVWKLVSVRLGWALVGCSCVGIGEC